VRKTFKIILVIFLALVIFAVAGLSVVFLDVAAYTATSSQTLNPSVSSTGKALVVYDPGLTGPAKNIAAKIADDLQTQGYQVELAGVKSNMATANLTQYQVIVVGGPIYGSKAASSVQNFLTILNLNPNSQAKIGVFGVGSFKTSNDQLYPLPSGSLLKITYAFKIDSSENATAESNHFVTQLLGRT
jgi:flavodoxin